MAHSGETEDKILVFSIALRIAAIFFGLAEELGGRALRCDGRM